MVLSLEDPGGRMSRLGKSEIAHGEILSVDQALRRIDRVTLDDAHRVAERVLSQPMTLTVLGPFARRPSGAIAAGGRGVIRVGVAGATGRMGREVCRAVSADPELTLAAAVSHSAPGSTLGQAIGLEGADAGLVLVEHLDAVRDAGIGVLVDFTSPVHASDHVAWGIANGVHVVVGTTGFEIDDAWRDAPVGVIVAPNFAIGAVLLVRFAEQAARHLPSAEVIELHHDRKVTPSGTAILTARRIASARREASGTPAGDDRHPGPEGPRSMASGSTVRLPGLVAHEEVIFGGQARPSRSGTTRPTERRSCRVCCSRSRRRPGPGSPSAWNRCWSRRERASAALRRRRRALVRAAGMPYPRTLAPGTPRRSPGAAPSAVRTQMSARGPNSARLPLPTSDDPKSVSETPASSRGR